ncbi:MAG: 5-carboxymethyl-2-hydroxymuconate Delta-isomerase [Rickettsiales bacterium]|nr:MAG: 5-carboxymethyl-2-hydroxymuconate Delta-isomerase [Rickettsiales bacterium]
MPHAVIEYTTNVNYPTEFAKITQIVHNVMIQSKLFSVKDIKTRSHKIDDFLLGEKGRQGSFVHVTIYLLEGRTILQKQTLSETLLEALQAPLINVDQLTINIQEIVKDTYRKHVRS